VLQRVLPPTGLALEIASGTGQHVVHFAKALPRWTWQPSEPDPQMRESIAAWVAETGPANVLAPLDLDVCRAEWPVERADAVVCINMIHISPWRATEHLLAGCERLLGPGGILFLYGPYRRFGRHTAPSNEVFDESLRQRNPEWGVRDLETVEETARIARVRASGSGRDAGQ
jgi:SAM-dependent methyltransferase